MSFSPPPRRLSTSSKRSEELINAYEAEEERIINILSRKLEQLREEKIQLESALEHESEAHVNRLTRELTALRRADPVPPPLPEPHHDALLDVLRRENDELRARLADAEHVAARNARLNAVFRAELVEHRTRAGVPVDSLLGPDDAPELPPARRSAHYTLPPPAPRPSSDIAFQPPSSDIAVPRPSSAIPVPRPSSRIHRPTEPTSASLSASPSPAVSPLVDRGGAESYGTELTAPPSEGSLHATPPPPGGRVGLTYPAAPPPSASSSLGPVPTGFAGPASPGYTHSPVGSPGVYTYTSPPYAGSPVVYTSPPAGASPAEGRSERRVVETGSLRPRRTVPAATAE